MQRLYRVLQGLLVLLLVLLLCVFVLGRGPGTLVWLNGSPPSWLPIAGAGVDWLPLLSASANNPKPSPTPSGSGSQTPQPTPDSSPSSTASPAPSPAPSPTFDLPSPSPAPVPSPAPTVAPVPSPTSPPSPAPTPTPLPLSVTAGATPTGGNYPLLVSFTTSVSGGTSPYTYAWTFGDGSTSTAADPTHTYTTNGTFSVAVTVTDSAGRTESYPPFAITVAIPPLAATAAAAPTGGLAPLAVAFTGSASNGTGPYTYSWAFGDGSGTSTAQNPPPYTYNLPGTYTATLTVTDSTSPTPGTATATVIVTVSQPVPSITGLSPNFGPESGGTTVSISGTYFENASAVKFGSKSATIVGGSITCDANGNCTLQANSPAEKAGTVSVTVTTPGGTTLAQNDQFTYVMAWLRASPATSPLAREGAALAQFGSTDVLFGGDDGVAALGDTWTWNGTTWTAGPLVGPAARTHASIAYYPDANVVVVFGGCPTAVLGCPLPLGDIWTWNGTAWTQVTTSGAAPSARTGASIAYKNGQLVVFGGFDGTAYLNETWALKYNTSSPHWAWTQLAVSAPSIRAYAAGGTDASGQLIVFGGYNGSGVLGDTWIWNGTAWSLAPFGQNPAPSARQLASIGLYKNPNGGTASGLALFGGVNGAVGSGTPQADTWTWNGTTWSLLPTSTSPSARYDAAAAQDTNGGVLLFGGDTGGSVSAETWRLS
jgi:PKD repeat protein